MNATELIHQFLCDRLGLDSQRVTDSAVLTEIGVDSLMLAELVFEAEEKLGISVSFNVKTPKTVGDMVALIDSRQLSKAA